MDSSSNKKKEFACNNCDKSFTRHSTLYIHVKSIHSGQTFSCDQCHKTFNQKSNLKSHVKMIHLKLRPFKCDFCPYLSKRKQTLSNHIQKMHCGPSTINGRKRQKVSLKCDFCNKKFQDEMVRAEHIVEDHAEQFFNMSENDVDGKEGNLVDDTCQSLYESHECDPKLNQLSPVVLLHKIKSYSSSQVEDLLKSATSNRVRSCRKN